jgi:hypothetical protein
MTFGGSEPSAAAASRPTSPIGPLNGNAAANRTPISGTITSLNIPNGATFWIRWADLNAASFDDGLAIDDFSLTPAANTTAPSGAGAANPNTVLAGNATLLTVVVTPGANPGSTGTRFFATDTRGTIFYDAAEIANPITVTTVVQ